MHIPKSVYANMDVQLIYRFALFNANAEVLENINLPFKNFRERNFYFSGNFHNRLPIISFSFFFLLL